MNKKLFMRCIFVLVFFSFISPVIAQPQVIDINNLKSVGIPIHAVELVLALFIAYTSLKFFRITKPINLFLFIYIAVGFFIINSLLYLLLYLSLTTTLEISFIGVYITSRIALMGMLVSFVIFFFQLHQDF